MRLRIKGDISDRIIARIDSSGGPDACWTWIGAHEQHGYGQVSFEGRPQLVTRLILSAILSRPIEPKKEACHSCDNPSCCNPTHLWEGTHRQNAQDMSSKGRQAFQRYPERAPRGDKNGSRIHPDRIPRGERQGNSILTAEQVTEIRRRYAKGNVTQKDLGVEFNTHKSNISIIVNRKQWFHLP